MNSEDILIFRIEADQYSFEHFILDKIITANSIESLMVKKNE